MENGLELHWKDGALRWENGTPFVMPQHVEVKVGEHEKGWNKTIGRTRDGAKKRFWFGKGDRGEAERKAAHVLNVWELIQQRDGDESAWDEESLALVTKGVHIDKMVKLAAQMDAATASISSDSASLQLMRVERSEIMPVQARLRPDDVESHVTLYAAIDVYCETIKVGGSSFHYRRRRIETLDDLKRFRADCALREIDRVTYLHEWGHRLYGGSEWAACRWSLNLFRRCFPRSFSSCKFEGHMLRRR